jgi:hypothetical protein
MISSIKPSVLIRPATLAQEANQVLAHSFLHKLPYGVEVWKNDVSIQRIKRFIELVQITRLAGNMEFT